MAFSFYSRNFILTGTLCLLYCTGFSQSYSNKESSVFSFTLGMTSSNLLNDSVKYQPGILCNGGFIYTVALADQLNIGIEALYTGKAFKNDSPIIKYRYFYIDVPLYLQYKLGDNIRFNLGAQYSTFTNSKIIVLEGTSGTGVNIKPHNNIKSTDYGFLGGVEIDLSENFALATRYTVSASTFAENGNINFGVFQLSLNYAVYRSQKQFFHRNKTGDKCG